MNQRSLFKVQPLILWDLEDIETLIQNLLGKQGLNLINLTLNSTVHSTPAVTMKKASRFQDDNHLSKHETFDTRS